MLVPTNLSEGYNNKRKNVWSKLNECPVAISIMNKPLGHCRITVFTIYQGFNKQVDSIMTRKWILLFFLLFFFRLP